MPTNNLARTAGWKMLAHLFYMLTRLGLPPLILAHVSLTEYGIWSVCFILISYMGLSAFGVSHAYIRYTAEYHARNEMPKLNQLLSSGLAITCTLSAVLLAGLWFGLPALLRVFRVPAELERLAFTLVFGTAAVFLLDLTFGAFGYVLHGLQLMTQQTTVWVVTFCLEAVLLAALLAGGWGVYALLWAFAVRYVLATVACAWLCWRAVPGLSVSWRHVDRVTLRLFYRYGAVVQVSGVLSNLMYSAEKVLAGALVGVQATGLLEIGEKFPLMACQVTGAMNAALLPSLAHLNAQAQREAMQRVYEQAARYLNLLTGLLMGFLCAFAGPLMLAWVGARPQLAQMTAILMLFCVPYQMNVITGPGSALHKGTGQPHRELFYPLTQLGLIAVIVGAGGAWRGFDLWTIAVGVAASMVLSAACYLTYTNHVLGVRGAAFWGRVVLPGLLPYAVGFALRWTTAGAWSWADGQRGRTLVLLVPVGAAYLLLTCGLGYRWLLPTDAQAMLRAKFAGAWQRLAGRRKDESTLEKIGAVSGV